MTDLLLFTFAVAAVLCAPGPTNALLCTSAGLVGIARSLPLILAELAGYCIAIGAMRLAGGPLITAVPSFGLLLRVLLIGYLLALSWRLWQTDPALIRKDARFITLPQVFVATLLNPKALVFAFAVFPSPDASRSIIPYAAVFTLVALCASTGWIAFGAVIGRLGQDGQARRLLPRLAAVVLSVLACAIGFSLVAARL